MLEGEGSVLEALDNAQVASFTVEGCSVLVQEECDGYFNLLLNKEQFGRLIAELQQMHDKMGTENGA